MPVLNDLTIVKAHVRAFVRDDSGQAFVESVIFLPMLLVALFAIIFFDRIGVLAERAETAVRYGDLVSFRNGQAYTAATLQLLLNQAVYGNSSSQLLGLCLAPAGTLNGPQVNLNAIPSAAPTAGSINDDIKSALYQAQTIGNATPAPSAEPFFQPDAVKQAGCTAGNLDINGNKGNGNPYPAGDMPLSVQTFSITAQVAPPAWVAPIFSTSACTPISGAWSGTCASTSANMAFINVATPATLLTCIPGMSIVLTIMNANAVGSNCQ